MWGLVDRALIQLPAAAPSGPGPAATTIATGLAHTEPPTSSSSSSSSFGTWKTSMLLNALTKLRAGPALASPAAQVRPLPRLSSPHLGPYIALNYSPM